ncbi:centriolin isoform X1 [Ornithorhynchus anatinus]|uniref:centriolin isoform X1 n=1 Tax=Ornithorhynchus anatinus TaxID=9258 RepID=UPI0010A81569|nr:centriolin isoform X1 [Ornithorhynchus anatinus]XP_028918336.1 centriolin isoform X1 [Ornithorhynchus anatinus]XP_039767729.1 centriolin isoform X1 [Ornithorhynchus anatinus]
MKKRPQQKPPPKTRMTPPRTPSPGSNFSSSKTRSLSPFSRPGSPATYTREQWSQQLDVTGESDVSFDIQDSKEDDSNPGIRYITESLVKKLTKQENLAFVNSLNLSLYKDGGKKFKYIENLENCSKLEVLNLSDNLIGKIEKLDKLLKLRDLNLSYNKISKIEGIENMQNLEKLNLAGNYIEHIPLWLGKKLRSLQVLNLKSNKISSLQDVAKLKALKDLTSLFLADNPITNLPHYRLYTIFHLRSLESLEGQPVTNQDRQQAFERFNLEEIEKLERDLEKKVKETEELKKKQSKFLEEIHHQDEVNKSLKEEAAQHKQNFTELQSDLSTKNELCCILVSVGVFLHALFQLKQKTMELTRACQKQYELEQELAFYKIDAKFEPLNYYPSESIELDDVPGESPYIGKSRYKRNMFAKESYIADHAQAIQIKNMGGNEHQRKQQIKREVQETLDTQLEDKEKSSQAAQGKLTELHNDMEESEQRILKATEEFKQLKDAVTQKRITEAEKGRLCQHLNGRLPLLNQLHQEALDLENQMEKQRREMAKKQKEVEDLQRVIDAIDPKDPRHIHMKAQKTIKEQHLNLMDKHYKQLESRLDEILSRIAKETEEIKDLEQQLTEGQIAANEALKKDLEGIITGLQGYLDSMKNQAKHAQDECEKLRTDKETLLQRLTELEDEKNQLEIVAVDAENMRKELTELECALQEQQEVNLSLRQAQGDLSAYEVELEAQLKTMDSRAIQHKEELDRLKRESQLENSALQAELEKERQALEIALARAQLSEEKEEENNKLSSQLQQLQGDNNFLKQQLKDFQNQLSHAGDGLIHPEEAAARVGELRRKLQAGVGEIRIQNPSDILGKSLADLQKQFNEILTQSQWEKEDAQDRQRRLQEEMALRQEQLADGQEAYRKACNRAAEARIQSDKRQHDARIRQLENEIQHLQENLKSMEEIQGLTDQQLQEADEEKERILMQLEDLENKKKLEDAKAQKQFLGLDKELKDLKKAMAASDKLATAELTIAKDQLKSLHGTVLKMNQERAEQLQETEKFSRQAARAAQDLTRAEAEIDLLQSLLKEKEEQFQVELEKADACTFVSNTQMLDIDQLNQTMKRQRAEIERLRNVLDHTRSDTKGGIENLLDEIATLRSVLSHQNDYITSIADPFRRRGYWYFMPPSSSSKVSSPSSHSTKDSGVGLKYTASTPAREESARGRQKKTARPLPAEGCWIYSPVRKGLQRSHYSRDRGSGEDSGAESESDVPVEPPFVPPSGSVIYTVLPDGAPVPQGTVIYGPPPPPVPASGRPHAPGTVIYGPPPAGAHIVYGPPPPNFSVPLIPVGVLHCNVPEHHNLENEISRLEDLVHHLESRRKTDKWARVSKKEQSIRGMEELHQNIEDLLREREELEYEVANLHKRIQKQNKRKDFIEGHMDGLIKELKIERSLKHHEDIIDEIECIEKTLLKRRAELREADRLLAEAENELAHSREKTKETIQKYSEAKRRLSRTETDAEELERRAQETAVKLVKADQQLRLLQADARDLEQHKLEQEEILKEINKLVSTRDSEFQYLGQKIGKLTGGLQKLHSDIEVAEGSEDHHLQILKESEHLLQDKKVELESLKNQKAALQQQDRTLGRQLGEKKEELRLLQESLIQTKTNLQEALQLGETEVAEKRKHIREVKSLLEELCAQKGELNVQMSEKKSQFSLLKQEVGKEEANLQVVIQQITKHKTELKHVLEMLQLESDELQSLKLQHDQKVNELKKIQAEVLEEKLQLDNLQRATRQQRGEMEWQKRLLEKDQREIEHLSMQIHTLQDSIESLNKEKQHLQENCDSLENKLAETKRILTDTEGSSKTAQSNVEKMEMDISRLQREVDQLNQDKLSLHKDIKTMQQHLEEKKEELFTLKDELTDVQDQLKRVEQDLKHSSQRQNELLDEQESLKDGINQHLKKFQDCQEKGERKMHQLQVLQTEIEERKVELAHQKTVLQQIQKAREDEEEKLEACKTKLKEQKQLLDWELMDQKNKLEQAIAKVVLAEERVKTLQEEEKWCATLEENLTRTRCQLSESEQQLQEKTSELIVLQKEMDCSKVDVNRLQDQILSERRKAEKQIAGLKEAIQTQRSQLEKTLLEQKQANSCLQKEVATIERTSQDNHERAKRLMTELSQMQQDYMDLRKQIKNQEDLERRQKEIKDTMKMLKWEVKDEIRTSLKDFNQSLPEPLEDVEAVFQGNKSFPSELESWKENFPFSANEELPCEEKLNLSQVHIMDEHWRGEALREKLRHREDRLKAQLRCCMSKQAEVLIKGKQQTEGTLHSLKRQVDALDELVSSTATDSFLSPNSTQLESLLSEEPCFTDCQTVFQNVFKRPGGGSPHSNFFH